MTTRPRSSRARASHRLVEPRSAGLDARATRRGSRPTARAGAAAGSARARVRGRPLPAWPPGLGRRAGRRPPRRRPPGRGDRRAARPRRRRSGPGSRRPATTTTGLPFHIASATVSPKPSARLFCTTTAARRWSALTIAAFSSASSIGQRREMDASAQRRRAASAPGARSPRRAPRRPPGRRRPPRRAGRRARDARLARVGVRSANAVQDADRVLEPVPARHLHDERPSRASGASWTTVGARSTRAGRAVLAPERRLGGARPVDEPDEPRIASHRVGRQHPGSWARTGRSRAGSRRSASPVELVPGEARRARTT